MNLFNIRSSSAEPPVPVPVPPAALPLNLQNSSSLSSDISNLIGQSVVAPTAENAIPLAPSPAPASPPMISPPAAPIIAVPPMMEPPAPPLPTAAEPPVAPLPITIGGPLGTPASLPQIVITQTPSQAQALTPANFSTAAPHANEAHVSAVSQVADKLRRSLNENSLVERQALTNDELSIDAELNSLEQQEIELHQLLSQLDALKDTLRERRGGLAARIHKMDAFDQNVLEELKVLES